MTGLVRHPAAITSEEAERMADAQEYINFAVHPSLLPGLVTWLDLYDMDLAVIEQAGEDKPPFAIASPRGLHRTPPPEKRHASSS